MNCPICLQKHNKFPIKCFEELTSQVTGLIIIRTAQGKAYKVSERDLAIEEKEEAFGKYIDTQGWK